MMGVSAVSSSQSELIALRHAIFSRSPSTSASASQHRKIAFERIRILGLLTKLPPEIGVTISLLRARENYLSTDQNCVDDGSIQHPIDATTAHLALTSAVDRFVTTFCDTSMHAKYRGNMADAAHAIGIPESIVQCRHDSTHHSLPGVSRLMREAQRALIWLWYRFWSTLDVSRPRYQPHDFKPLLRDYRSRRREEVLKRERPRVDRALVHEYRAQGKVRRGHTWMQRLANALVQEEKGLVPKGRHVGDDMVGAFQFWIPLVLRMIKQDHNFMLYLLRALQNACAYRDLASVGSIRDGGQEGANAELAIHMRKPDARTEALCAWMIRLIADTRMWLSDEKRLQSWRSMSWQLSNVSILYPDLWTEWIKIEQALL